MFSKWNLLTAATFLLSTIQAVVAKPPGRPYSVWLADSAISRSQGRGLNSVGEVLVSYDHATFQRSLEAVYNQTKDAKYFDWIKLGADTVIQPNGTILDYNLTYYTLDDVRLGPTWMWLYEQTRDPKYKIAASTLRSQLLTQPRTSEGAFWHRSTYPHQQWLDGVYMADVHYAYWTSRFDAHNRTAWADILLQFQLMEAHTRVPTTNLLKHGYDNSKSTVWADPVTGAAPEVWDRAVGWYFMALVDTLDWWPTSPAYRQGRNELLGYFRRLARGVKDAMTPEGGWWLIMSQPGREGNYLESSGGAMFLYSLLKGIRKGYLDRRTYWPTIERAYRYHAETFVMAETNGTASWLGTVEVGSLSGNGTFEYYISVPLRKNDLKGLSPFILASVEFERAGGRL